MADPVKIPFSRTTASVLLDAIRAIAALLVCLGHWRNLLFISYPQLPFHHRWLFAIPYVITDAGHQAVMIFFVLSGYLISGSIYRGMSAGSFTWRRYLTHRVVRLWIVLIPALVLGGLFDTAGLHLHRAPALYTGHVANVLGLFVQQRLNTNCFLQSLFFLQGIRGATFGSNGPLWSLSNEFWYYILFPLGLVALRRATSVPVRVLSIAAFVVVAWFLGPLIMDLFPVWLMGAALAAFPLLRIRPVARQLILTLYPILFFALVKQHSIPPLASDYVLGAATFLFISCLLTRKSPAPAARWVDLSRTGARFSYTLYVVHVPFLVFLTSISAGDTRWVPDLRHVTMALVWLACTVAYAYAIGWLTEFRTDTVRSWVEKRVIPSQRPVSVAAGS